MPDYQFLRKLLYALVLLTFTTIFSSEVLADAIAPISSYIKTPSAPNGDNGWYVTPVVFDLSATDLESGVKEINYRVDNGTWQIVTFSESPNLAPNPSFEDTGGGAASILYWDASITGADTAYSQDISTYAPGFADISAKITTTGTGWHSLNHANDFAVASPLSNMSASLWFKTENAPGGAYFKVYAISDDGLGGQLVTLIGSSPKIFNTQDWTQVSYDFVVTVPDALGIYMDFGLDGSGTIWGDAATIRQTTTAATTQVTVGSDSSNHTLEFYAVDWANNTETYSCSSPIKNCVTFKIDQTAPGNWHDSGAFRGLFGPSNHHLYVYVTVDDATSGLSTFTDKYQYHTEQNPGYGRFSDIMHCSSTWQPDQWVTPLYSPPFFPGVHEALLITPKTDFCNSNWKVCKNVKFLAEDMAGNTSTKDLCINGPWIKLRGGGIVKSGEGINMIAEANGDNTDSLIETGTSQVDFFSSTRDWVVTDSPNSYVDYNYGKLWDMVNTSKTELGNSLTTSSGVFYKNSDFTINNQSVPSGYGTATFSQVVFIDGTLTIDKDLSIATNSTVMFIVSGDIKINKQVDTLTAALLTDNDIYTAYDASEGESSSTLVLKGMYSADKIYFQRTLQGTENNNTPSEDFTYEPKYLIKLKDYLGKRTVEWKNIE